MDRFPVAQGRRPLLGVGLVAAAMAIAPAAQAQVALPMVASIANVGLMLPASAAALVGSACPQVAGQMALAQPARAPSKAALLSGSSSGMTALERLIQAQSGHAESAETTTAYGEASAALPTQATFTPLSLQSFSQCAGQGQGDGLAALVLPALALPKTGPNTLTSSLPAGAAQTEFLASKRIRIAKTAFSADWRRVSHSGISRSWARQHLGTTNGGNAALVEAVNAYANRTIRFADDQDVWGKADYWATAKTTFRLGEGDCEDIAIAKMQMLAALGIKREDMVLTLAKDLIRRADHAVLIVKLDGRFVMLDNTTDKLIDASVAQGYRPILSFSGDTSWLHGY